MVTPDPSIAGRPAASARKAVLGFLAGGLVIAAVAWAIGARRPPHPVTARSTLVRESRTGFVGSRACANCHPGEFASHSRSGHSRTLRPAGRTAAARRLGGKTVADPERPGSTWTYELHDGRLSAERTESGKSEHFDFDYAFGSGQHATTFVTLTERTPDRPAIFEHRLTVFAHREAPDITPGQGLARGAGRQGDGVAGRQYETASTLKCFECHTVATSDRGPRYLDEASMIPDVGCESCHGPGRGHVEAARNGADDRRLAMPLGLDERPADQEIRLCGSCHRLPETVTPALIQPRHSALVRFQPVGLMQSACFRKSKGRMTCSTCHDPHARTSTDVAAYEAVCLSCHQGASRTPCSVSPATGCIDCHMPRRDASRGMMMTDHWIRSRPEAEAGGSN